MNLKCLNLSVYIILQIMEAVTRSRSAKKVLLKFLENSQGNISAGVSFFFLKEWLSEEKKKGSRTGVFFWVLRNLSEHWFWTMPTNACYDDQVLRQSSTMFYVLPLRFKLILLIILELTISWNFIMILQTFNSGFFPT